MRSNITLSLALKETRLLYQRVDVKEARVVAAFQVGDAAGEERREDWRFTVLCLYFD